MRHHRSSIVYTCNNRIYRPKSIFYVFLGNNFLLFLWRPWSSSICSRWLMFVVTLLPVLWMAQRALCLPVVRLFVRACPGGGLPLTSSFNTVSFWNTSAWVLLRMINLSYSHLIAGGSVAEWLACWTQTQKGPGFKSQPRRCRVAVLGKPTKQQYL